MATRKATPRMSSPLPSGKWVTIGLATFAASAAVIVAVGYNAMSNESSQDGRSAVNIGTSASQERKLSPTGNQGFRDFDPEILYPNVEASVPRERKLSPTGNQGYRDPDPEILYPNVAASISSERKLSPTGRQGFRDFDPEILYPNP